MKVYCYVNAGPQKTICDDRILINNTIIASGFYSTELQNSRKASFAVADGVGGNKAGYYAASQVAFALSEANLPDSLSVQAIEQLILGANQKLIDEASTARNLERMATTLSGICWDGTNWFLYHVGNTRIYQWAFGALNQITEDHTWVREMQLKGFNEQELQGSINKNQITACVGGGDSKWIKKLYITDITSAISNSQRILITSDGFHEFIEPSILEASMERIPDYQEYCIQAAQFARKNGSQDDISIVLIDI